MIMIHVSMNCVCVLTLFIFFLSFLDLCLYSIVETHENFLLKLLKNLKFFCSRFFNYSLFSPFVTSSNVTLLDCLILFHRSLRCYAFCGLFCFVLHTDSSISVLNFTHLFFCSASSSVHPTKVFF